MADSTYDPSAGVASRPGYMPEVEGTALDPVVGSVNWLDYRYPGFAEDKRKWLYVDDHYSGRVIEDGFIDKYLVRRESAETDGDYKERRELTVYYDHFSLVVDTLAGMVMKEPVTRDWTKEEGLGMPNVAGSIAERIAKNVDGAGMNYSTFLFRLLSSLIRFRKSFVLVNGVTDDVPYVTAKLLRPWQVTNKIVEGGRLTEAMVHSFVDGRKSLRDDPKKSEMEVYTHYTLDGWATYRIERGKGKAVEHMIGSGAYEYYMDATRSRRRLPLVSLELSLDRDVSYMAAKKANGIFNKQSSRDAALFKMTLPRFSLVADDDMFDKFVANSQTYKGVLQDSPDSMRPHYFLSPPVDGAELTTRVLTDDERKFYETTFKDFADSAPSRKTATEIEQNFAQGIEAFLTLVSAEMEEAELQVLSLMEQAEFPEKVDRWGGVTVSRGKTFESISLDRMMQRLSAVVFPDGRMPIGKTARVDLTERLLSKWKIGYDKAEIEAEAEQGAVDATRLAQTFGAIGL